MAWAYVLIVALVCLGGCPACAVRSPASSTPVTPPPSILPAVQTWLRQLPAPPVADAAFDQLRIYVPTSSGVVVALARDTGEISWSAAADTKWPAVVAGDHVFVAAASQLLQFDAATGADGPVLDLPAPLAAPMSLAGERLLLPLASGEVVAVTGGRLEWTRQLEAPARSAVATDASAGYLSLTNERTVALSLDSGSLRWTSEPLLAALTRPVVSVDRVLVGTGDGRAFAFDAATGRVAWSLTAGGAIVGAVATPTRFYITALDNIVRAVDRSTGNQRWKHVTTTRSVTAPVLYRDLVMLHGNRPTLIALDGACGEERGSFQLPDELNDPLLQGPPVVFAPPADADAPTGTVAVIVMRNGTTIGIGQAPAADKKDEAVQDPDENSAAKGDAEKGDLENDASNDTAAPAKP